MSWFEEYLNAFEKAVVLGVAQGQMGMQKKPVPTSPGRLAKKKIASVLGKQIDTGKVVVIDYYGYMKKSRGFRNMTRAVAADFKGKQLKMVDVPVVHFNAIRLEILAKIAPELVTRFADFKKAVLDAREFNHNYRT